MNLFERLPELKILRPHWPGGCDDRSTHRVEVHGVSIGGTEPVFTDRSHDRTVIGRLKQTHTQAGQGLGRDDGYKMAFKI